MLFPATAPGRVFELAHRPVSVTAQAARPDLVAIAEAVDTVRRQGFDAYRQP